MIKWKYVHNLQSKKEKKSENSWVFEKELNQRREKSVEIKKSQRKEASFRLKRMLNKKNRLPPQELKGQKAHSFFIAKFKVVFVKKKDETGRFSVIIPASVVKKAVDRHYWKRQIIEAAKEWKNKGIDAIIFVKNSPDRKEKKELLSALSSEINKI